jgi:hypothetical protein
MSLSDQSPRNLQVDNGPVGVSTQSVFYEVLSGNFSESLACILDMRRPVPTREELRRISDYSCASGAMTCACYGMGGFRLRTGKFYNDSNWWCDQCMGPEAEVVKLAKIIKKRMSDSEIRKFYVDKFPKVEKPWVPTQEDIDAEKSDW